MSQSSGISSQSSVKGLNFGHETPAVTKNFEQGSAGPAAQQDPALVQWFEQANAYYNAVMAGDPSTPKPTEAEWNDFLAQLQWAQGQLGYGGAGGAGGTLGMVGGGYGAQQGPQSNQFGGMSGTMDNWVYTNATTKVGFTGTGTHDIWGNDVTIDVAPVSAKVTIEQTTDTRFQPNEQVVKVVVTDPATGTEAVYFLHDFDPTKDKLKINTPEEAQITVDNTGFADGVVTWAEFKPGGAKDPNAKPDASIEGVEQADGSMLYEPDFAGETVNFWANPSEAGDSQKHIVYADANISVKPSDEVVVTGPNSDGVVTVTVKHGGGLPEGSEDVYEVQKGYDVNINQKGEYVTIGGQPGTDGVPAALADRVTLNGVTDGAGNESSIDADKMIDDLLNASGLTNTNQLESALRQHGLLGSGQDINDLKKAISAVPPTFPPNPLNANFLNFLQTIDIDSNGLKSNLQDYQETVNDCKPDSEKKSALEDANDSLVELLSILYPNAIISTESVNQSSASFSINGEDYTWNFNGSDIVVTEAPEPPPSPLVRFDLADDFVVQIPHL